MELGKIVLFRAGLCGDLFGSGGLVRVLVTGASGLIGRELCALLEREGHQVSRTSRHPSSSNAVQWVPESQLLPSQAIAGADAIVHLAGEPIAESRWSSEVKRKIRDSRVIGTRNLVAGLEAATKTPLILVSGSAVGYYGDAGDRELDESAPNGGDFLSLVCRDWEKEALSAAKLGVRVALVRTGVVLSTKGGALARMLSPFRLGAGGKLGSGQQWFPWIHIGDIAGLFLHSLVTDIVSGPVNGVAPGIVNNADYTGTLASVLDRPALVSVPEFALRLLFGEMSVVLLSSQRVRPAVALKTGYQFKHPELRSALSDLLK
jgi:uncharacterized protein (TIGR01777 family)